jgi:hypothetical protein
VHELIPDLNTRLRALAEANRYGLGPQEEITVLSPEVQVRVRQTIQLIASKPSWDSQALIDALGEQVWT